MRNQDEVLERFQEMRLRLLRARKDKLLSKCYINCVHNVRLKVRTIGLVGLCQHPDLLRKRGKPLVCNDDEFSGRCSCFECRHSEKSVFDDFEGILKSPARCGEEYPKLAILLWFLQDENLDNRLWHSRLSGHIKRIFCEARKVIFLKWL